MPDDEGRREGGKPVGETRPRGTVSENSRKSALHKDKGYIATADSDIKKRTHIRGLIRQTYLFIQSTNALRVDLCICTIDLLLV